ncbi:MAG TPA: phage holin family protein [Gaiellaceae bacterium]|jgi:hypothetical protein
MTETVEPVAEALEEVESEPSLTELLEQLARELNGLVFAETRLAASRHKPAVLRAGRDFAAALLAALAFLAAFALANAAAVHALSRVMSTWLAALLLGAGWAVVGAVLALFVAARVRRVTGWDAENAEQARADAQQAVREALERLSPAVTKEIALAAVPMAGDMAGGVVDAGAEIIESADDLVEAMTENVPAGGVVNQMWDVVLMPGRLGVRVATTVLKRGAGG